MNTRQSIQKKRGPITFMLQALTHALSYAIKYIENKFYHFFMLVHIPSRKCNKLMHISKPMPMLNTMPSKSTIKETRQAPLC